MRSKNPPTKCLVLKMARALSKQGLTASKNIKAKVIPFGGITKLDLNPDVTLEATKGKLKGYVIAGYDKNGDEYFASTYADGGDALWLLERCKARLLAPDS